MARPKAADPVVRIHVVIPQTQYEQLLTVTGINQGLERKAAYGRLSQVIRLALAYYLDNVAPATPPQFEGAHVHDLTLI